MPPPRALQLTRMLTGSTLLRLLILISTHVAWTPSGSAAVAVADGTHAPLSTIERPLVVAEARQAASGVPMPRRPALRGGGAESDDEGTAGSPPPRDADIEFLRGLHRPEFDNDDALDQWLECDNPGDPFLPVTADVKAKFEEAVRLFDAEMCAEGQHDWRQEMTKAIRRRTTVTCLDGSGRPAGTAIDVMQAIAKDGAPTSSHAPDVTPETSRDISRSGQDLFSAAWEGNLTAVAVHIRKSVLAGQGRGGEVSSRRHSLQEASGLDQEVDGMEGWSAMHVAALRGRTGVIRLLAAAGAWVDKPSYSKQTPLHLAALQGRCKAARVLMSIGANASAVDVAGSSPLHLAAAAGHGDVCSELLEHGARADAANAEGQTPALVAEERGHRRVLEILRGAARGARGSYTQVVYGNDESAGSSGEILEDAEV